MSTHWRTFRLSDLELCKLKFLHAHNTLHFSEEILSKLCLKASATTVPWYMDFFFLKKRNIKKKNPISSIKRQINSRRLLFRAVICPDNHLISIDFQRYQCDSFIWMSSLLDSARSDELPDSSFKFPDDAIDFYATGKWMKGKVRGQQRVRAAWVESRVGDQQGQHVSDR